MANLNHTHPPPELASLAFPSTDSDSDPEEQDLPLPIPPAQWDVDAHLPRLERESSKDVTQEHLILALDHVGRLLDARGYRWAVMGGLAMFMHGNQSRNTRDVDLTVEVGPKGVLEALVDGRIYRPPLLSMAGSGCGRFYVLTGPQYGEPVSSHVVEVDIIMPGHLGAPRTLSDTAATITRTAQTAAGERTYTVLSVQNLCRAKLHALDQRDAERDLVDLEWFCMNFFAEIQEIAHTLDEQERVNFVRKYEVKHPGSVEAVGVLRDILQLGDIDIEDK